ncbi:conserved hypothetical protein [Luminiphilus syltensis NOR5-1B]|uniref:Glycosyltransferase RgtA/B/C/D-like domain-containing protein n=1 Tax=Luminiphilus syltensis NOR5-1B TaxID=565045 RepID=B8KR31_9GAMM|nr:hypothetical protein [Luminiphilus syltensis]EED36132.1 conserved hypothetical protein [Luminiphilus syltensis NOR5-1B]
MAPNKIKYNIAQASWINKSTLVLVLITVAISFYGAVTSDNGTYDQFWHVKVGIDLLYRGLSPLIDHYSFTFENSSVKLQPYPFQILYGFLERRLGFEHATIALKSFFFLTFLISLFFLIKCSDAKGLVAALGLAASTYFIQQRLVPRPEIVDFTLLSIAAILYSMADREFSPKNVAAILVLSLAWVNFHAGIIPYVIFSGLYIQKFYDFTSKGTHKIASEWPLFWASGLILLVVGWANQDIAHPIINALQFSDSWDRISEHQSSLILIGEGSAIIAFWAVALSVTAWAVASRNIGIAIVCLIFIYASIDRIRMISMAGVAISVLFFVMASNERSKVTFLTLSVGIRALLVLLGLAATLTFVANFHYVPKKIPRYSETIPSDVVDYLKAQSGRGGNIFNMYHQGGYLLYRLPPTYKIFIDGRTGILYPPSHFLKFNQFTDSHPGKARDLAAQYQIDLAIWPFSKLTHLSIGKDFNLTPEYIGSSNVLYSKTGGLQEIADILMFPSCTPKIIEHMNKNKMKEIIDAQKPRNEILKELTFALESVPVGVDGFLESTNLMKNSIFYRDAYLRPLMYSAISQEDYERTKKAFEALSNRSTLDLIVMAYNARDNKDTDFQTSLLVAVMTSYWEDSSPERLITRPQAVKILELYTTLALDTESNEGINNLARNFSKRHRIEMNPSRSTSLDNYIYTDHCESLLSMSGAPLPDIAF